MFLNEEKASRLSVKVPKNVGKKKSTKCLFC